MKQFSKCCTSLLLVLLAVASSYGKEINTLPITVFGDSFYIAKGTETNLTSKDSTLQIAQDDAINDTILYVLEDTEVSFDKNNITNAHAIHVKNEYKAIAIVESKTVKAKTPSASQKETALFLALPKNKEKTTAQFVVSVVVPSPTTLKSNKNNLVFVQNTVASSIFRKRKASKKCLCYTVANAVQKQTTYALLSRPPTLA